MPETDSEDGEHDPLTLAGFPVAVYGAMFGATLAGQLVGMVVDAAVVGRRLIWVPVALSVAAEALVGERFGAARLGRRPTVGELGRLSGIYSLGVAALSIPLALWTAAARPGAADPVDPVAAALLVAGTLVVATLARWGAMAGLSSLARRP